MTVNDVVLLLTLIFAVIFGTIEAIFIVLNYFNNKK